MCTFKRAREPVSCCFVLPGGLLGVFDEVQSLCCNQGTVGANTQLLWFCTYLSLDALNPSRHIQFPPLASAAAEKVPKLDKDECCPVCADCELLSMK